ncbi:MAG TPA: hypothetical protein VEK34_11105 [Methylocella sp.]|nr:hypothetical protein [Methylocella sp.]
MFDEASPNGTHANSFTIKWKWFFAIAKTVVLGALGSGFWDLIFRPSLAWAAGVLLTISTLGLDSPRDGIYADIAMGHYERASLSVLALLSGLIVSLVVAVPLFKYFMYREERAHPNFSRRRYKNTIAILYIVIFATFVTFNMTRVIYTTYAQASIDQLYRSILPYISDDQEKRLVSHMATISGMTT